MTDQTGDEKRPDDRRWLGIRKGSWQIAAYVVVVLSVCAAMWGYKVNGDRDVKRTAELAERVQIQSDYEGCVRGNDFRSVVSRIVIRATEPSPTVDVQTLDGFDDIDPATQRVFIDIFARIAAADPDAPGTFRSDALADLKPRQCEEEYPTADHKGGV